MPERCGEEQLHLGRGLLAGEQVADPAAGHDADDRVGDPPAPREMARVPNPCAVLLPADIGECRLRGSRADGLARQRDLVLQRDAQHCRGAHEHHAGEAATVRELAVRAIDPPYCSIRSRIACSSHTRTPWTAPPPGERSSRLPVSRSLERQRCARTSASSRIPHARVCAHPAPTAASISPSSSSLIPALTRAGTGPNSSSAAFPDTTSTRSPSPSMLPRAARSPHAKHRSRRPAPSPVAPASALARLAVLHHRLLLIEGPHSLAE